MNNDPQQPFQPVEPTPPTTPPTPPTVPVAPQAAPVTPVTPTPPSQNFDTPPPLTENPFLVTPPLKKSRKGLIITLIVAVVVIGLGVAAYFVFFQPKTTQTATTDTTDTTEQVTDRAVDITNKIKKAIDTELSQQYPLLTVTERAGAPTYQAAKAKYAVASNDFGKSLDIDSKSTDLKAGYTSIEKSVKGVLDTEPGLKVTSNEWRSVYQGDSVICALYLSMSPTTVSCANISDYNAVSEAVKPLAEAYATANPEETTILAYQMPKITQKGNGYASASVAMSNADGGVGGFAGLFYSKDNSWTFWKGTQSVLLCADYNTPDLQYAFAGDACEDATTNQMSTVKTTTVQ